MKSLKALYAVILFLSVAAPAMAGGINLSGPHYNLNIIGVENPKTTPLTSSDRHTIFVGLGKNGTVSSRIYLSPGPFAVCDGNAFDPAIDCSGNQIASQGAVFQLPCDIATPTANGCPSGTASQAYQIWGRALGTPGGSVTITTCATDDTGTLICSTDNALFSRTKGKQTFVNVTTPLTSLDACFDVSGSVVCETVSIFDPALQNYFWDYANTGIRLVQLRFYPM